MFKIYDSTPVGSSYDADRWTFYLKALAVKLIGSSLLKKNKLCKNIAGLHNGTKLKPITYAKFRIFPLLCPSQVI